MLTATEYLNKVIEYRKAGRFDLIHEMAIRRSQANRALRKGQTALFDEVPPDNFQPTVQQLLIDQKGEGPDNKPAPAVTAPK